MATQQDVIKAFMKALDVHTLKRSNFSNDKQFTKKLLDSAVKACSSFDGVQDAIDKMIADRNKAGNADTFLKKYCGINLANKDTGAITGSDAGGSKVKTASSIVPESGTLDGSFDKNYFKVNGLTVKLGQDEGTGTVSRSFKSLSKQERYIWRSLHSYWVKSGLNLISESYGDNFSFKKEQSSVGTDKPATKTLYITFDKSKKHSGLTYYADDWNVFGRQKPTKGLSIGISLHYFDKATGKDGTNTKLYSLDRLVAHELTHAVMKANIDYYDYLPAFIKEGMAELTVGIDDENASGIKAMADNANYLKKALSLTDYSTIKISGVQDPTYAAGYMFLRYLAKQAANGGAYPYNKSVVGTSAKDSIDNFFSGSTITALGGDDTIRNYASGVTIDSGAGNDKIINEGSNVSIRGGAGADYIFNDSLASNVSIFAQDGKNEIYNHAQKVTISGGNDADYISNFNSNVSIFGGAGNDSLFNSSVGSSVTLEGGNDDDYISNKGSKVLIRGGAGADTIYNYSALVTIDGGNGNDIIWGDAGNDTISGGANNDKLHGEGGKDKLYGGNGNDSLWGGSGKDVFIYKPGEGTDRIKDYSFSEGDIFKILKTDGSTASYTKSAFASNKLTLTIDGGGSVIFEGVSSNDKFKINGTTYTIKGKSLIK